MDDRKSTIDGSLNFAGIVGRLFSEQLLAAGGADARLAPAPAPAKEAALPEGQHATLSLRFEGALSGQCFLLCSGAAAAALAGENAEADLLLQRALGAVCEPLSAELFAHYGSVRVNLAEGAELPEDWEPIALLSASGESGSESTMTLVADGELQRGLTRLARIASAAEASGITGGNLGLVMDVELNVTLRFGQRQLSLREVMDLSSGSVVELDREVDEPVELILDGRVIARGEAVIVDGNYGVRVTEVLQPMVF